MRRTSFQDMNCSLARSLELIGDWWTPLVLRDLLLGVSRFEQMQRRLGIARNVLTDRLNGLVDAGIVEKVPYQTNPERHDYRLTKMGRELWVVLTTLRQWGDRWLAEDGAPVELIHEPCGQRVELVPTCSGCGEVLYGRDLRSVPGPGASADRPSPVPDPES